MSILAEGLCKQYGDQMAVDEVSFLVEKGEITGFLGPNGAGKTTTMRMLSGFFPPSAGRASVAGYDIREDPISVKRQVGYLAENNPLYLDLYVLEYLGFVARLHGLDKRRKRIGEVIERTGLGDHRHKKVGSLSKGYRQRLGLAQAILHDPAVLILDEPVSGLDPNQLSDIRDLIRSLGREKTVLFSSHILQEIEAVCERVIIINRGRIVADGRLSDLKERMHGRQCLLLETRDPLPDEWLAGIPGLSQIRRIGPNRVALFYQPPDDIREVVFHRITGRDGVILEMKREERTMQEVFRVLTDTKTTPNDKS